MHPFRFERDGERHVDRKNGLQTHCYGWPEYNYTVAVEPVAGPMVDKWPVMERVYFEFGYTHWSEGGAKYCAIASAQRNPAFDRDFPGRQEELFDAVFPLILPVSLWSFPELESDVIPVEPVVLRERMRSYSSFFSHRHDPGHPDYRMYNPEIGLREKASGARAKESIVGFFRSLLR